MVEFSLMGASMLRILKVRLRVNLQVAKTWQGKSVRVVFIS